MKPSREPTVAVVAAVVTAVAVVAVVVVTAVAVIEITIVTSANHAGSKQATELAQTTRIRIYPCQFVKIRGYFLASGTTFNETCSAPRFTTNTYSWPAFISPNAAV